MQKTVKKKIQAWAVWPKYLKSHTDLVSPHANALDSLWLFMEADKH
jgi:hypothetical protein